MDRSGRPRSATAFDALRERRQEAIERAEDLRIGKQAQIASATACWPTRQLVIEDHVPIVIEKPVAEVPKSSGWQGAPAAAVQRVADAKLPQVDLLDAPPGRMETVTSDSLEMTSRA